MFVTETMTSWHNGSIFLFLILLESIVSLVSEGLCWNEDVTQFLFGPGLEWRCHTIDLFLYFISEKLKPGSLKKKKQ